MFNGPGRGAATLTEPSRSAGQRAAQFGALVPVDPSQAYALFSRDYFYMAFLASLGTLQVAVSMGGYSGLYLFPWRAASRAAGVVLIISAVLFFCLSPLWVEGPWAAGSVRADSATRDWGTAGWGDLGAARNVNDIDGGLSGGAQALWFPIAASLALVTSIATGFLGRRVTGKAGGQVSGEIDMERPGVGGLDALRDGDFQSAIGRSVAEMRRSLRLDLQSIWLSTPAWAIPRLVARMIWR